MKIEVNQPSVFGTKMSSHRRNVKSQSDLWYLYTYVHNHCANWVNISSKYYGFALTVIEKWTFQDFPI